MKNALLLINPSSGRGRALRLAGPVASALASSGLRVTQHVTLGLDDAAAAAAEAAPDTVVAALGGDGFFGSVANGVVAAGARLLPLPGGTGNDICSQLGLGKDPVRAARSYQKLRAVEMDVARVRTGDGAEASFLGTASVGFDSHANARANTYTRNLGMFTYIAAGLQTFSTYRGSMFTVTVDGRERTEHGWFVAVSNSGSYGGGLVVAPEARANDGLLDVTFQREGSALRVVETFAKSLVRRTGGASRADFSLGREVAVSSPEDLVVYADGDPVGPLPAVFSVPGTVRAFASPTSSVFRRQPGP